MAMERKGKPLQTSGDRGRMSDGKNAWRKMTPTQRHGFLTWIVGEKVLFVREISGARALSTISSIQLRGEQIS